MSQRKSQQLASRSRTAAPLSWAELEDLDSRLFQGLPREALQAALSFATHRKVSAHSIVTNQDDPADYLFLLTLGSARHFFATSEGRKVLLQWLRPGDIIGGVALLHRPTKYLVSTELVTDGSLAVWDRKAIRTVISRHPSMYDNALTIAMDYLVWYVAAHTALVARSARERLAQVLSCLASGFGHSVPGGIELSISNEELGNAANVTAFTASRLLGTWQRRGALVKSRGKILICDPQQFPDAVRQQVFAPSISLGRNESSRRNNEVKGHRTGVLV